MIAVIPVAGHGTRLEPHTLKLQKCLLPVAGKPVLEHILNRLTDAGVSDIIPLLNLSIFLIFSWTSSFRWSEGEKCLAVISTFIFSVPFLYGYFTLVNGTGRFKV